MPKQIRVPEKVQDELLYKNYIGDIPQCLLAEEYNLSKPTISLAIKFAFERFRKKNIAIFEELTK